MAKIVKGFIEIQDLQSTTHGAVSPLGEMSVWSMTYTKDKSEYADPNIDGYRLVSVSCRDTELGYLEPSNINVTEAVSVAAAAVAYVNQHLAPYDLEDFRASLAAELFNEVTGLILGPLVGNGTIELPQWIQWNSLNENGTSIKIWLSDQAFANQFDEYEITVIPPLSNLDDFFLAPNAVKTKLAEITPSQMMSAVQTAKEGYPETYIRTESFNYINPINSTDKVSTAWTVLIYGIQGDNIDAIKDAIVDYVVSNSSHTRAEWEALMPDLFKRTEFLLLPRWDKIAIPDLAVQSGVYASISNADEIVDFVKLNGTIYPNEWLIAENIQTFPFIYKALTLVAVKGTNNETFAENLAKLFPDYIPAPTTSLDFNRMLEKTQDWILLMQEMLMVAENMANYLTIPDPFRVITRGGKTYLSAYYSGVNFLVAPKGTYV